MAITPVGKMRFARPRSLRGLYFWLRRKRSISLPGSFRMICGEMPIVGKVNPPQPLTVMIVGGEGCSPSFQYRKAIDPPGFFNPGTPGVQIPAPVAELKFRCALEHPLEHEEKCEFTVK